MSFDIFETLLLIFLFMGVGGGIYIAARTNKIRFSLQTIFGLVTAACVLFGFVAAFGPNAIELGLRLIYGALLPLANLIVISVLIVLTLNTRGEQQAIHIGRLVPLLALAILDVARIIMYGPMQNGGAIYTIAFYATAWLSGLACKRSFRFGYQIVEIQDRVAPAVNRDDRQRPLSGVYEPT